jgi:ketosteroid isomerase-like protein
MGDSMKRLTLVVLLLTLLAFAKSKRDQAVSEVAQAERDFAKMSVAEGTRNAFFANFTEDGIAFGPQPAKMRDLFGPAPPAGTPRKTKLDWHPEWTDASQAGDIGFSTGPSVTYDFATGKPIRWGTFASVWRKQPDGKWKVVVDIGTQHAEPPAGSDKRWSAGAPSGYKAKNIDVKAEAEKLTEFERSFVSGRILSGYQKVLTQESRLHRPGIFPVLGASTIVDDLTKSADESVSFEPAFVSVSASGDLGYSYGAYTTQPGDKNGYYAHFWKRDKNGDWKLMIDVTNPEEPKK